MGKIAKKHVEGRTKEERIKVRKQLGPLKGLTVQPGTRARYDKALEKFSSWLQREGLSLPTAKIHLDAVVSDYVESLWCEGEGRALASDTLAAIQDRQPQVKGHLLGCWRLLKTWNINEIPNRAPPLPEQALLAMVGFSLFKNEIAFAISLLLAYYGMLRTGELLTVKAKDFTQRQELQPFVLSLGYTKGGKRMGAAESITVGVEDLARRVFQWVNNSSPSTPLCPAAHIWRKMFSNTLEALNFHGFNFRPYSLRRGGSTFWFSQHGSFDRLVVQGRWQSQKTARLYVNEGLAMMAEMTLPWTPVTRSYLSFYTRSKQTGLPKLSPTTKGRGAGGRGKNKKNSRSVKKLFFVKGALFSPETYKRDRVWLFEDLAWQESKPLPYDFGWSLP